MKWSSHAHRTFKISDSEFTPHSLTAKDHGGNGHFYRKLMHSYCTCLPMERGGSKRANLGYLDANPLKKISWPRLSHSQFFEGHVVHA